LHVALSVLFSDHPNSEGAEAPHPPLTWSLLKDTGMSLNLPGENLYHGHNLSPSNRDDLVFYQNIAGTTPMKGWRNRRVKGRGGGGDGSSSRFFQINNPPETLSHYLPHRFSGLPPSLQCPCISNKARLYL
jgi:hypothetical protein